MSLDDSHVTYVDPVTHQATTSLSSVQTLDNNFTVYRVELAGSLMFVLAGGASSSWTLSLTGDQTSSQTILKMDANATSGDTHSDPTFGGHTFYLGTRTQAGLANVNLNYPSSILNVVEVDQSGGASNTLMIDSNVSGTGGLEKTGSGRLVMEEYSPFLTGTASNTFSGNFELAAGSVLVGRDTDLTSGNPSLRHGALGLGTVTLAGGIIGSADSLTHTLQNHIVVTGNFTIASAPGTGGLNFSGAVDLGSSARVVTVSSPSTISGVVGGTGGLTETGANALTLSGSNTYSGGTAIDGGVLQITSDGNLGGAPGSPATNLTFDGGTGGTLHIGGDVTLNSNRNVLLSANGTFNTQSFTLTIPGSVGGTATLAKAGSGTLALTGNYTNSAGTVVSAGVLELGGSADSAAAFAGAGDMVVNSGGTLTSGGILLGNLTINGYQAISSGLGTAGTSKLNSLTIANSGGSFTGKLDLSDSRLIVEATDSTDKASKIAGLTSAIKSGSNGATWTGDGITSSVAAGDPAHHGVGIWDNGILELTAFGGQSVDSNSILVAYAHLGDANRDHVVDTGDLSIVSNNWEQSRNNWAQGDLNGDGVVDLSDLSIVTNNWDDTDTYTNDMVMSDQERLANFLAAASQFAVLKPYLPVFAEYGLDAPLWAFAGITAAPAPAPEPASLALLGMGGVMLMKRRRA